MADSYVQGSFAFRCLRDEASFLDEAITALNAIMQEDEPGPPSQGMAAMMSPTRRDEPWSGLVDRMPDPEFPGINADVTMDSVPDDKDALVVCFSSMSDFDPLAIAEVIRACCPTTLASGPIGFEWASTCSRPRLDEFGGGWCAVFADRIEIENTGRALWRTLRQGMASPGMGTTDPG